MMIDALDLFTNLGNQSIALFRVEFKDTSHLDLHQFKDIFASYFTDKIRLERSQAQVDMSHGLIHILRVFKLCILINTFFNKYLFEGSEEESFFLLGFLYL